MSWSPKPDSAVPAAGPTLATLPSSLPARVTALELDARDGAWLRAVGITEGERVTVLRRALFGGPLHVRTGAGGEFAVDRALAARITVTVATDPPE